MPTLVTQGAFGDVGEKASTIIEAAYNSFANICGHDLGASSDGLFLLNVGGQNNSATYTRTFTLGAADFGKRNFKRIRFLYIGCFASGDFTVSVMADNSGTWDDQLVTVQKIGLQEIKVPMSRDIQGRYLSVKVSSANHFKIDWVSAAVTVLEAGKTGY